MYNKQYKQLSERTEKKFPTGLALPVEIFKELQEALKLFKDLANKVDGIKKHIIYTPLETTGVTCLMLTQAQIEILHAVLGLLSEVEEVIEILLVKDIKDIDKVHLAEELGDFMWYVQIVLRNTNLNMGDIQDINIRKLLARFPDKFNEGQAVARDVAKEKQAMQGVDQ
jgi:NTP pyrophosphatase (non-canonical NTP hydrolase)